MFNFTSIASDRYLNAVSSFLLRRGYDVTEMEDPTIDLLAIDEESGVAALVVIIANDGNFDESFAARKDFERCLLDCVSGGAIPLDYQVRFDAICVRAFGDKAILRHHASCLDGALDA